MHALQVHLRNKFLAGGLAAGPVVVLVWGVLWLEEHTRPLTQPLGFHFPGLGIVLALVLVYLLGLVVTSLVGMFALRLADGALERVPGLNQVYRAWKDVLVLPPSKAGTFHEVVLVPVGEGRTYQLGFTSGLPLSSDPSALCVFLPGVPNPLAGRLVLVGRAECLPAGIPIDAAIKFLLSTGNYLPAEMRPLPNGNAPAAQGNETAKQSREGPR